MKKMFLAIMAITLIVLTACSVTLQPGGKKGKDGLIASNIPDLQTKNYPYLQVFSWTMSGVEMYVRSLLEFDLSCIPAGSRVAKARLSLYEYHHSVDPLTNGHYHSKGSNAFQIRQITQPWSEDSLNWNKQPTTTTERMVIAPQDTSATQDYLNLDVTAIVQYWVNNPGSNYGFMLKLVEEYPYRSILFATSDCSIPAKRPKLVISYK